VVAETTVVAEEVPFTRVPKAAVMPLSAALTHGSVMLRAAADVEAEGDVAPEDDEDDEAQPARPARYAASAAAGRIRR
jgi:hypothetical protein